jgi:predicted alpha/beta hydrolase family esterase
VTARFLILHGLASHRPPQHWQFLLAARLVERGYGVGSPALPDEDNPDLPSWLEVLRAELAELGTEELTVVCHSLSCLLWFHAAKQNHDPVRRLLLVSPPDSAAVPDAAASFRIAAFDPPPVAASAREIAIACSDADPFNPGGAQAMYGDSLGITANVVPGGGHLIPATGYGPWPCTPPWSASLASL